MRQDRWRHYLRRAWWWAWQAPWPGQASPPVRLLLVGGQVLLGLLLGLGMIALAQAVPPLPLPREVLFLLGLALGLLISVIGLTRRRP